MHVMGSGSPPLRFEGAASASTSAREERFGIVVLEYSVEGCRVAGECSCEGHVEAAVLDHRGYEYGAQKRRFLQDKHPQNSVPSESTQNSIQDPKFWTLGMKASTVGYIGYADDTYPSYGESPKISPRCEIHLFSTAPSESTRKTGLVRCLQHVQM